MLTPFTNVKGVHMSAQTRRERARDATVAEIRQTARALLVQEGPDALTLRAIAREMGMSPPALYRYYASHDEIVAALVNDILDEITATVAAAGAGPAEPLDRLMAACRAFRRWSLAHPREFQLTFASTVGGPPVGHEHGAPHVPDADCEDDTFGGVFLDLIVDIWEHAPFLVPAESDLPESLVAQLRAFSASTGDRLPLGALAAYLTGWVRLYGGVTIEVFGHIGFALEDPEALFEAMLADMRRQLTTPPAGQSSTDSPGASRR
jgi:AcrR family transcriptional regulator